MLIVKSDTAQEVKNSFSYELLQLDGSLVKNSNEQSFKFWEALFFNEKINKYPSHYRSK